MKPREFINFFKTRSGKLVLFVAAFGGGLILFGVFRHRSRKPGELDVSLARPQANQSDKPQVVQSVERPMQPFYPPPPKPELPTVPASKDPRALAQATTKEPLPATLAPISLFADSAAGTPEPKSVSSVYAPYGRLISCETVITVDSASIQTPIVGLITENVYHAGKLVIPAGTEVHGTAQTDHHRERIASGGSWTLVWQTGEELRLKAIALDREFAGDQTGWGITDGSAGLRGQIIKSDDMAEIKLFAATFLSGAAGALTEQQPTVFGPVSSPSLNNAPFAGAQKVLSVYAQRIYEAVQRDGFYVRVPSGKQFYLYVLQVIDRADATIGGSAKPFAGENPAPLRESVAPVTMPEATPPSANPVFQP
ncbi:MAG: TrbI/VirB10 family protein [Verrucomicrobiota bacterium]